jgi:hypothetical protein
VEIRHRGGRKSAGEEYFSIMEVKMTFDFLYSEVDQKLTPAKLRRIAFAEKEAAFPEACVDDLTQLNTIGEIPSEGEYSFAIAAKQLAEAEPIIEAVASVTRDEPPSKFLLTRDRVKIVVANRACFAQIVLRPVVPVSDIADREIEFLIEQRTLLEMARRLSSGSLSFKYVPSRRCLDVNASNVDLVLPARLDGFVEHIFRIPPKEIKKVSPVRFINALEFVSFYANRDYAHPTLFQIEVQPETIASAAYLEGRELGVAVAGSHRGLGIFDCPDLAGFDFIMPIQPVLSALTGVLWRLHFDHAHLLNFEDYVLLRDQNVSFGFRKGGSRFFEIKRFFSEKADELVVAPRQEIVSILKKLAVVDPDLELLVRVTLTGDGIYGNLKLEVRDRAGRKSFDAVEVCRRSTNPVLPLITHEFPKIEFCVSLSMLLRTLQHLNSEKIWLEPLVKRVRVHDLRKSAHACAILPLSTGGNARL